MAKEQTISDSKKRNPKSAQPGLGLPCSTTSSGPVECLGLIFPSDEERRRYFLDKLREKLKDSTFRKIGGFPIGEDEDILALSDPPYYTACPNPWLGDFVKHCGTSYNPRKLYHRKPFAADVGEGKYDPIYKLHPYPTKVPHKAIMRYILHYTKPGDLVLDGFCGTGMTGVAAQYCGDPKEVRALGYRILDDGTILDDTAEPFSTVGSRRAILNDLAPSATFIAANYNMPLDSQSYLECVQQILGELDKECSWMYETTHSDGRTSGRINYVVWSDVFICPECASEIVFWDQAVDKEAGEVREEFPCSNCKASLTKTRLDRAWVTSYDDLIGKTVKQAKQVPVRINYSIATKRYEKRPEKTDLALLKRIQEAKIPYWFPTSRMIPGGESRRNDPIGLTHVHHFYTKRTLWVLASFLHRVPDISTKFLLTKVAFQLTKLYRFTYQSGVWGAGGGPLSGTLYVPSLVKELDPIKQLRTGLEARLRAIAPVKRQDVAISTSSFCCVPEINDETVDYIFLDPPFGSNLMYSELGCFWEAWLKVLTNTSQEAVENLPLGKDLDDYKTLMTACFKEAFRVLKPGRWMTVEFSNTKATVWNLIQTAMQETGFVVANVSALDKKKGSFKAVTTPTAVKQDLVISAYKPNGGLEDRFAKSGETETGVWDFVRMHLGNLPVVKPKSGQLEPIAERDPRILYDRTVAFYIQHGIPVPISSPEFQAGLAEKFPERDSMYFLPDQAAEYDKVRMKMEGIGQLTIFVEDERSAVQWLRNYLKEKPSKYNEVMPEFFEQLNQGWKKWETRPELRALLDQYFLCYNGEGPIPPQIHSYLSTNFKEFRNLSSDHPILRSKARDRWYLPDPKKNTDVEQLREKRLLEEFWSYMPPGYEPASRRSISGTATLPGIQVPQQKIPKGKRLAIVRTEAVRVGFKFCFQRNDYQTIIAVARHVHEDVIHNDEQLLMIYDSAVTRTGGDVE